MAVMALVGCNSRLATPVLDVKYDEVERLSVASAQQINVGDGQSEVIKALGTPNIISKSSSGNTSWVYDRIGSYFETVETTMGGGLRLFGYGRASGKVTKSAVTSKTFIVVIDFDQDSNVANLTYRYTQY